MLVKTESKWECRNFPIIHVILWKKQSVPLSSNILETGQACCRSDRLSLKLQSYNCRVETSGTRIHNWFWLVDRHMLRWGQFTGGVRCCLRDFVTSSPAPIYETDEPIIACPIAPNADSARWSCKQSSKVQKAFRTMSTVIQFLSSLPSFSPLITILVWLWIGASSFNMLLCSKIAKMMSSAF